MIYINNLTSKKLKEELNEKFKVKSFRSDQLFRWIHDKKIVDLKQCKNLPDKLIKQLKENYAYDTLEKIQTLESKEDNTICIHGVQTW
jgi:adenine C2-methylase RlmN of 23S rRNA A2503 and tRNA A37